jgi:hypothetical protein
MPIFPEFPVKVFGNREDASKTKVRGPGQKCSISLFAAELIFRVKSGSWLFEEIKTSKGLFQSLSLTRKTLFTAASFKALAPRP